MSCIIPPDPVGGFNRILPWSSLWYIFAILENVIPRAMTDVIIVKGRTIFVLKNTCHYFFKPLFFSFFSSSWPFMCHFFIWYYFLILISPVVRMLCIGELFFLVDHIVVVLVVPPKLGNRIVWPIRHNYQYVGPAILPIEISDKCHRHTSALFLHCQI